MKHKIYTNFTAFFIQERLFMTMQMFAEGSTETQAKFGEWRQLHSALKFYIEQDFVFFSADNDLARSKIVMLNHSLNLIG